MGAGAGYTITVKDAQFTSITSFTPVSYDSEWTLLTVECEANAVGTVGGESYYYACRDIEGVPLTVTHMTINIGELLDDFLTKEASERIFNELKNDWEIRTYYNMYALPVFHEKVQMSDLDMERIQNALCSHWFTFSGEASLGGGWVHDTFTGEFTVEVERPYADESYDIQITDEFIVDFIDKAVTGDNRVYSAHFNGNPLDDWFDTEDDAIEALKAEISASIAENGPESVDFYECWVEEWFEIMIDAEGSTDVDIDSSYRVYEASEDYDYDEYI